MDREVIAMPLVSFLLNIVVFVGFAIFALLNIELLTNMTPQGIETSELSLTPIGYIVLVLFIAITGLINIFVSGAVTRAALDRFKGTDPTIATSLRAARSNFKALAVFGLLSAGIGFILSEIVERIPFVGGKIVGLLANLAWNVASFFALPVIMEKTQYIGPLQAVKRSSHLIKQVWGESLVISVGIGLIAVLSILGYSAAVIGLVVFTVTALGSAPFAVGLGVLFALGYIVILIVFSTLSAYVKAAIYHYAVTGTSPVMFDNELLKQSFTTKKARKLFSH